MTASRSATHRRRKRLLIVGAGNLGREVLDWALDVPASKRDWEIGGFLDSRQLTLKGLGAPIRVLGDPLTFKFTPNDVLVCAIGDPRIKLEYCLKLRARGCRFITVIHPTATLGSGNRIGEGCVIAPGAVVTTNVSLGDFVGLDLHATVSHDSVVGDGSTLSPHSTVLGHCILGKGVLLGSHACTLPNAEVGDFAIVAAGGVVLSKVEPRTTVAGVPARRLRKT
jgi:sugar O-acyltransferase (sialic acid O-acetyltransferase NeuD family)